MQCCVVLKICCLHEKVADDGNTNTVPRRFYFCADEALVASVIFYSSPPLSLLFCQAMFTSRIVYAGFYELLEMLSVWRLKRLYVPYLLQLNSLTNSR